jgi:hypothetical protein
MPIVKGLLITALVALVLGTVITAAPDMARYQKMREM